MMWMSFGNNVLRPRSFSMPEIAECAYGAEQNGNLVCKAEIRKELIQRLLPCAAEGRRVPRDLVRALAAKACRPTCYKDERNWRKVLECACGMLRKQTIEDKGECTMSLDAECRSRDYLYGRLLALADAAEESTYDKQTIRTTNAKRFFSAFSSRPSQTWAVIYGKLIPYFDKMPPAERELYENQINSITALLEHIDFENNAPLKPEFLHIYSCQLNKINHKKTETKEKK